MKGSSIWKRQDVAEKRKALARGGFSVLTVGLLLVAGCSYFEKAPPPEPLPPTVFEIGLAQMANGDYQDAEQAFRQSAARCESGSDGRHSLLFLSILALDPRNPAAEPDSALLMAERFLNLPGNSREEMLQAEALYVTALDYGANPETRVDQTNPGFAVRFGDCDQPFPGRAQRPLPVVEESKLGRMQSLDAERGTLTEDNQALRWRVGQLRRSGDSLQAHIDTLEAELVRIRQLIRLPDTLRTRPPDTGSVAVAPAPDSGQALTPDELLSLILGLDRNLPRP